MELGIRKRDIGRNGGQNSEREREKEIKRVSILIQSKLIIVIVEQ